jgi:predicted RNase H-like HicB family nuclease
MMLAVGREEGFTMASRFALEYWIDDGWYVGRLRQMPAVFSQGETLEALEENIKDAYELMLEEEGEALPRQEVQSED